MYWKNQRSSQEEEHQRRMSQKLSEWINTFSGREQLAAEKFAESLEVIPLTLGQNAGMDSIDTMTDLRARQSKGSTWTGIDARNSRIADIAKLDIVEPLS